MFDIMRSILIFEGQELTIQNLTFSHTIPISDLHTDSVLMKKTWVTDCFAK